MSLREIFFHNLIKFQEHSVSNFVDNQIAAFAFDFSHVSNESTKGIHNLVKSCANKFANHINKTGIVTKISETNIAVIVNSDLKNNCPLELGRHFFNIVDEAMADSFYQDNSSVKACLGMSIYPNDTGNIVDLFLKAEKALERAKLMPDNGFCIYDDHIERYDIKKISEINNLLERAIKSNAFSFHYQPKINLKTNEVVGAESLIRLNFEDTRSISPAEFIPVAEITGLITEIGKISLYENIKQIAEWKRLGLKYPTISINLSPQSFQSTDIYDFIKYNLLALDVSPKDICIEITESAFFKEISKSKDIISSIRDLGVKFSLDDFGAGFSTPHILGSFPFDEVKLDKTLTHKLLNKMGDDATVNDDFFINNLLFLPQNISLVAEGIEEAHQSDVLSAVCNVGQGYLFSKPLEPNAFLIYLNDKIVALPEDSLSKDLIYVDVQNYRPRLP